MTKRNSDRRAGPQQNHSMRRSMDIDFSKPPAIKKRKRGSLLKQIEMAPEFMTIDEAATFWRCSRRKVERKLKAKKIPKYKDGHRTLLRIKDVRAHARRMRQQ